MENKLKIVTSNDGSHTIYRKDIDEHYHSIHGSIQESLHVFINAGLIDFLTTYNTKQLNILEIGFGTGLNALLTIQENLRLKQQINYHSLEPFPVPQNIIEHINYKDINAKLFTKIHQANWNKLELIEENFKLMKIKSKLEDFNSTQNYDLIYYDAFGPNSQHEMWSLPLFNKLYGLLNQPGALVTYCAKGQVRRDLQSVGFKMERLDGPKGKREMLRGIKN